MQEFQSKNCRLIELFISCMKPYLYMCTHMTCHVIFSLQLLMRVMAVSSAHPDQEDVPRAPPPSPEFPIRQSQQFNFAELLTIASLQGENSPSSSTEHSRPTSPLFYHSPDHAHPPSGSLSPLEPADSPYNFSSKLSELTLSIDEMRNGICHPNQMPGGKQLICGSLPVNGEMHAYMQQHESRFNNSDFRQFLDSDQNDPSLHNLTERRRKISLKRQHDNQEEYFYDTKSPGIEIINKKLCHGNDRVGSAPSHAQRSHTFSGASSVTRPFQKLSENPSLNTNGVPFHVGSLPVDRLGNHIPPTVAHRKPSSDCLSPGGLRTVGFSTSETANTEYQMEGVETEGERDAPPTSIPISVTQMDWNNGGISLSSNVPSAHTEPQNMMSGFSFGLPQNYSTSFEPSSLSYHLNVPGFDSMPVGGFLSGQDQSIPQITLTPHHFSKSL